MFILVVWAKTTSLANRPTDTLNRRPYQGTITCRLPVCACQGSIRCSRPTRSRDASADAGRDDVMSVKGEGEHMLTSAQISQFKADGYLKGGPVLTGEPGG